MSYDDMLEKFEEERKEAARKAEVQAKNILDKLTLAGAESITIEFDGAGDSGTIQEIDGLTSNVYITKDDLENWAYDLIEGTGVDWYNNEGGFGTISIDVPKRTYNFEVHYRCSELGASGEATV